MPWAAQICYRYPNLEMLKLGLKPKLRASEVVCWYKTEVQVKIEITIYPRLLHNGFVSKERHNERAT